MAEVVVSAPAPGAYIEEIVVRPDHVADAGRPVSTLN
jgi:hypothetical protein